MTNSQLNSRGDEGTLLGLLGNCYADLGQINRACDLYEQALVVARQIGDRGNEAAWLSNLTLRFAEQGDTDRALDYSEQALTIAYEVAHPRLQVEILADLAQVLIDLERCHLALDRANEGVRIAEEIGNGVASQRSGQVLALAYLYINDLAHARNTTLAARKYDDPLNNHRVSAILGVTAMRLGDQQEALEAFRLAVEQAYTILNMTPQYYAALDSKALALCGLTLCGAGDYCSAATKAYRAARSIYSGPGVVKRVLRLFDALAETDANGQLVNVRIAARGNHT